MPCKTHDGCMPGNSDVMLPCLVRHRAHVTPWRIAAGTQHVCVCARAALCSACPRTSGCTVPCTKHHAHTRHTQPYTQHPHAQRPHDRHDRACRSSFTSRARHHNTPLACTTTHACTHTYRHGAGACTHTHTHTHTHTLTFTQGRRVRTHIHTHKAGALVTWHGCRCLWCCCLAHTGPGTQAGRRLLARTAHTNAHQHQQHNTHTMACALRCNATGAKWVKIVPRARRHQHTHTRARPRTHCTAAPTAAAGAHMLPGSTTRRRQHQRASTQARTRA
jgi:hypothetical protein